MPPKRKAAAKAKEEEQQPVEIFEDIVFAVVAKLSGNKTKVAFKKEIEDAGGVVASSITKKVTHIVATEDDLENDKVKKAIEDGLKVVTEEWVNQSIAKGKKLDEKDFEVKSSESEKKAEPEEKKEEATETKPKRGGRKTKAAETEEKNEKSSEKNEKNEKGEEEKNIKKIKYEKKGRAAVDSNCPVAKSAHVLEIGSDIYDCMLNQTDLAYGQKGHNKFYVLQCLEKDGGSSWWVWTRWGRVGVVGQNKLETFSSQQSAISTFEKKFTEKTKNQWRNRANFRHVDGKYDLIEMDYGNDAPDDDELKEKMKQKQKERENTKSKTDARVGELVKLLFDLKMFESTLVEMELDIKKMPLGKISKAQLEKGYHVLEDLEEALKKNKGNSVLTQLTSKFYTIIPHDFGFKKPPVIDTQENLQKKFDLLEALGDIEVAQTMMDKEKKEDIEHPIDAKYKLLKNDIEALDKNGDEWKRITTYLNNTKQNWNLTLLDAYKISRHGEQDGFKEFEDIENRKLLWHGSKVAVFAAILSTGLKIMPHSGGRVGRGLYFADCIGKSAGYCGLHNNIGIVLLNEVVLGKIHKINRDDPSLVKPPNGYDSVLATGTTAPDEKKDFIDKNLSVSKHPVIIPQGEMKNTGLSSSFLHNEFLVYDAKQVNMKYLLMLRWN